MSNVVRWAKNLVGMGWMWLCCQWFGGAVDIGVAFVEPSMLSGVVLSNACVMWLRVWRRVTNGVDQLWRLWLVAALLRGLLHPRAARSSRMRRSELRQYPHQLHVLARWPSYGHPRIEAFAAPWARCALIQSTWACGC